MSRESISTIGESKQFIHPAAVLFLLGAFALSGCTTPAASRKTTLVPDSQPAAYSPADPVRRHDPFQH